MGLEQGQVNTIPKYSNRKGPRPSEDMGMVSACRCLALDALVFQAYPHSLGEEASHSQPWYKLFSKFHILTNYTGMTLSRDTYKHTIKNAKQKQNQGVQTPEGTPHKTETSFIKTASAIIRIDTTFVQETTRNLYETVRNRYA